MPVYKNGDITKANVTDIKPYGAFVTLDNKYSGLIHISEITDGYVRNIGDYVNVGDVLDAKVIGVDEEKHQIRLSIKDTLGKSKRAKIKETKLGFKPLKDNLDMWINEKISEIDNINTNNK